MVLLVEHTMDVYKQRGREEERPPLRRIAFGDLLAWRSRSRVPPSICRSLLMASRPLELSGMVIQCVLLSACLSDGAKCLIMESRFWRGSQC